MRGSWFFKGVVGIVNSQSSLAFLSNFSVACSRLCAARSRL